MNNLSLKRRAMIIRDQYRLKTFDQETLRKYYMRHGVTFKRPDYTYWKSLAENEELKKKQFAFVNELGTMICNRSYDEIIYLDETTFHLWQKMSKCWIRKGMKLALVKNRGPSLTVIGAISQERGLVHFEVFEESNNSDLFTNFIINLKNKCEGKRVVVVLDNLKIHYTKKLEAVYDQDFKEIFLPTYSSQLNPIEILWSVVKRKWI